MGARRTGFVVVTAPTTQFARASRSGPFAQSARSDRRAEQIRLGQSKNAFRSQVVTYTRSDGGGHAFVVYRKGPFTIADDNLGFHAVMPPFSNRSPAEALRLAKVFQLATRGHSNAISASFVGRY